MPGPVRIMLLLLVANACAGQPHRPEAAAPPSIVLIIADDLGYGDVGCFGGDLVTPHLDRAGEGGARLTSFYAAAPVCTPSRYAMMTGRWPHRSADGLDGVLMMFDERHAGRGLRAGEITVAEDLRGGVPHGAGRQVAPRSRRGVEPADGARVRRLPRLLTGPVGRPSTVSMRAGALPAADGDLQDAVDPRDVRMPQGSPADTPRWQHVLAVECLQSDPLAFHRHATAGRFDSPPGVAVDAEHGFVWFRWMKRTVLRSRSGGGAATTARLSTMKGCGIWVMSRPGSSSASKKVPSR